MHITLLRKIGIEEQQHLLNQITFLLFFFSPCGYLFYIKTAVPIVFCFII